MKNRLIYLLMILTFTSSCFILPRPLTIQKRLKVHAADISKTDTSKLNFKGIYLTHSPYKQKDGDSVIYGYYQFFPDGRVYQSRPFYNRKPTTEELRDFYKGYSCVYFIKGNKLYVEDYAYDSYFLREGFFSNDLKQIYFTDQRNSSGKHTNKVTSIYMLDYP